MIQGSKYKDIHGCTRHMDTGIFGYTETNREIHEYKNKHGCTFLLLRIQE